jgi:hypothetical protein
MQKINTTIYNEEARIILRQYTDLDAIRHCLDMLRSEFLRKLHANL